MLQESENTLKSIREGGLAIKAASTDYEKAVIYNIKSICLFVYNQIIRKTGPFSINFYSPAMKVERFASIPLRRADWWKLLRYRNLEIFQSLHTPLQLSLLIVTLSKSHQNWKDFSLEKYFFSFTNKISDNLNSKRYFERWHPFLPKICPEMKYASKCIVYNRKLKLSCNVFLKSVTTQLIHFFDFS